VAGRLWKLVREDDDRAADLELGVGDPAVGRGHAPALGCSERPLVELDRSVRVVDGEDTG
jgi:hypothetical protein